MYMLLPPYVKDGVGLAYLIEFLCGKHEKKPNHSTKFIINNNKIFSLVFKFQPI